METYYNIENVKGKLRAKKLINTPIPSVSTPFKQWRSVKRDRYAQHNDANLYLYKLSELLFFFLIFQMPGRIESQTTQMKNETCSFLHYTVQLYSTCANYQRRKASIFKQCLSFLPYLLRRPHQLKRVYQHFWSPLFFPRSSSSHVRGKHPTRDE